MNIYHVYNKARLLQCDDFTMWHCVSWHWRLFFADAPCKINKVLSHPTLPITITAQEDRHIQFFDNNTGQLTLS